MGRRDYVMAGGIEGRQRLRLLARLMRPTTMALLRRIGVGPGMTCLDVGCGGGDVTFELARLVAPKGRVVGIDRDTAKIALARDEARTRGIANAAFHETEIEVLGSEASYDVVYARFVLTHMTEPAAALAAMIRQARPGARIVLEDIDFAGHFAHPENPWFQRYQDLYVAVVEARGGDPFIGPKLPAMALDAGLRHVEAAVVQPAGIGEEVKLIHPVTLEIIAESVLAEGLAGRDELQEIVDGLYAMARDGRTMAGMPRVVQVWARRP
jgi:SAM-dependent methyltransferase